VREAFRVSCIAGVRRAFDILFELLGRFDDGDDRMVFFADEGRSWMVGVDWKRVLPAWFWVLSATADPAEYARRFETFVGRYCNYQRTELLTEARQVATPSQLKELAEL
jgi:hypothetical protein